jgi:hypothetical protein
MRFDFQLVRIIQGEDPAQEDLYGQIEEAFGKLEELGRDAGFSPTRSQA